MFLVERAVTSFEENTLNVLVDKDQDPHFIVLDEQLFFLVNLKISDDLNSGDVVGLSVSIPRYRIEKKNSFKANLEAPFNNSKSCRKRLERIITTREKKQLALFAFFSRIWYDYYFIAKVIHFCFPVVKDKRLVDSFFKIVKVGFGLFSQVLSPNTIGFYLLLKLGKFYRRKALYFLIKNFKMKFRRLAPKRRMHRKKRKNK